jgi:hypothetical protein
MRARARTLGLAAGSFQSYRECPQPRLDVGHIKSPRLKRSHRMAPGLFLLLPIDVVSQGLIVDADVKLNR